MNAASPRLHPPLTLRTKLAFGVGSFAEAIGLFSITSYAMLYYNQVLGLRADLAGLALSASLLLDGPCDLLMGSISDRTRSRLGRRHPYMYAAPLPIALALFAVFNPPHGLGGLSLFLWFLVSVVLLRQFMNIFHTPHSALGGELSQDYTERTKVMAYASFATSLGATAQAWIALSFFFKATPAYPQGLLNPAPYAGYALTMASLVFVCLYVSSWFTRDVIPRLPTPPADQARFSAREFLRDVGKAFANRNYSLLIFGYFCLTMTNGLRQGLQLYTGTFFWGLSSEQLRWIFLASAIGAIPAFLITAWLHRRFDKKRTIIAASIVQAISPAAPIWLGLAGVLGPHTPGLLPLLVGFSALGWVGYGVLTIGVLSAMADVADENELRYGVRQEGVMYAMRNLFGKVDQAVGAGLSGLILTLIAFPIHARFGHVPHEAVTKIALSDGVLATLPGLVAIVPYVFYSISFASNSRTKALLAERRGPTATATGLRVTTDEAAVL